MLRLYFTLAVAAFSSMTSASISCLTVGNIATATWSRSNGQTCTFTGVVGDNFGTNAAGGEYSCQGRCGAGCSGTSLGNAYTQDCYNHDVCSYFENASGGGSDPNCGDEFNAAVDDTLTGFLTCGETNPNWAPVAPSHGPTCS